MTDNKNIVEHKNIVIVEQKDDNIEWDVCCSHSSKSFVKYLSTVVISIIVLIFSIIMVILNPERDNSIYFSLISAIVSIYIPPPQIDKSN